MAKTPFSGIQIYSALAPKPGPAVPKTWSPFFNNFTSLPIASISPASSSPSRVIFGFDKPVNNLEK